MVGIQRRITYSVTAAYLLSMLFPPFVFVSVGGMVQGLGYGFLLSWPDAHGSTGTVDVALLVAEWVGIAILGRLAFAVTDCKFPASIIQTIILSINRRADERIEIARIEASSRERVAEIMAGRK